jgi:HTH-type transcriptional regulator / antitoxin HigA
MTNKFNLEAFSPGDYIREELDARGWSQVDLSEITGRTPAAINEIVMAKRSVTPEMAQSLADAFGTSAELWMNLESAYQLSQGIQSDPVVSKRAKIYAMAPINEMKKRGWIQDSKNADVLESQVCRFYEINSIDDKIVFAHAARKSTDYSSVSISQLTWLYRARYLARAVPLTGKFSKRSFQAAMQNLANLKEEPVEIRHVPGVLANAGIRFLIIEHLSETKLDGVTFWLDDSPVIAMSLRYDRIDYFWHTLMHEMDHVWHSEGVTDPTLDTQLVGTDAQPFDQKPANEQRADRAGANFLIDQNALTDFIHRVGPLYSHLRVQRFAKNHQVHPGIVVGQLQFRGAIKYTHSRAFLVRVRDIVTSSGALTDGWGHAPQL